jgi:hypothetical protein
VPEVPPVLVHRQFDSEEDGESGGVGNGEGQHSAQIVARGQRHERADGAGDTLRSEVGADRGQNSDVHD